MSTKTSIKRIALVAATALTLGGFSVITAGSAHAATGTATAIVVTSDTLGNSATALAAGKYVSSPVLDTRGISSFTVTGGDTVTLGFAAVGGTVTANESVTVTMAGYGNLLQFETNTAAPSGGEFWVHTTGGPVAPSFTATTTPGSYTLNITLKRDGSKPDLTTSVTMVVSAAAGYSNGLSTALIAAAGGTPTTTTDAIAVSGSKTASTTEVGRIATTLNKSDGTAAGTSIGNTLKASVSGPGFLTYSASSFTANPCVVSPTYSSTIGRSLSVSNAASAGYWLVCADGTSGTSTVSFTVVDAAGTTYALATKSLVFYGTASALSVAASNFTIGKSGGATTGATSSLGLGITAQPAFVIAEKDSSGNLVNGGIPTIVSADSTIVASGACLLDTNDATYGYGPVGYYDCNFTTASSAKSGQKVTLTARITDPNKTDGSYLTTTFDVTIGGSVAKEVIATDKASYVFGENMIVTITATDSSGNAVYDGAASPALTFNKQVGGTVPAASYYVGGKKANKVNTLFAPSLSGDFLITATGGDAASTPLSAKATVAGGEESSLALDAANAATDAANNAYDEAQNATQAAQDALAAVSALAKQVSSLIASVKSLTALVSKIKAKVGA